MFDSATLTKRYSVLWVNTSIILGVAAALITAVFFISTFQSIENKRIAQNIYLLNQQISVVNHIGVLAKYFDRSTVTIPLSTAEIENAIDSALPVGMAENVQPNITLVRNELRDLGRQLEQILRNFSDNKHHVPDSVHASYFDGDNGVGPKIKHYVAATYKLSQLSKDDFQRLDAHLEFISKLKNDIDHDLKNILTKYYFFFIDRAGRQGQSHWQYLVLIFMGFCGALFIFVLRPLQREINSAYTQAILANKIKTEFLTSVSHEIRTPMHGIISAGENLSSSHLNSKQKDYVRTIMSSADSLLDVINDILGFSALESGETNVELTRFNLYDLTHDLVQIMEERAQLKKLELIVRYEQNVPHEVCGDSSLIRQVLYHLLSNSIKFTESGYIVVTVDITEPLSQGDIALKFTVEDTGIGIEADKLEIIFEQFVQGNGGTKRLFSGTGLGLSISKKLVELMGGNIRVGSVLNEGATFTFVIPINNAENLQSATLQNYAGVLGSILFICDDVEFRRLILSELGMSGVQIVCKSSDEFMHVGESQLDAIALVAIDYFVKGGSPFSLLQQAKNKGLFSNALFTCVLRKNDEVAAKNLNEQGFGGVFALPADTEMLIQLLSMNSAHYQPSMRRPLSLVAKESVSALENNLQGASILLVEDNRINAALAEDMLADFGVNVTVAENGQIALDKIRAGENFDLVLMDCMMPVMDGFEATRLIRELPQTIGKTLPIIALTANAMVGDKERCLDVGMNAYLSKPVRKRDLQQTINKWLQHRSTSAASVHSSNQHVSNKAPKVVDFTQTVTSQDRQVKASGQSSVVNAPLTESNTKPPIIVPLSPATELHNAKATPSKLPGEHLSDERPGVAQQHAGGEIQDSVTVSSDTVSAHSASDEADKEVTSNAEEANVGVKLLYLDVTAVVKAKAMMKRRFPIMIEYFLEDTQNYIDQIREGIRERNYSQLLVSSHTIKSSSRQMGAFAVSDISKEIEFLAREEVASFDTLSDLTERLQDQFDLSRIDFNCLLSDAS